MVQAGLSPRLQRLGNTLRTDRPDDDSRRAERRSAPGRVAGARLVWCPLNPWAFVALKLGFGKARGGRIPRSGAVTDEQPSPSPISAQPAGRQLFFPQTSLITPYRSISGYARRSRLVCVKNFLPRKLTNLGETTLVPGLDF